MSTAETTSTGAFPDHPNWVPAQRFAFLCAVIGLAVFGVVGALGYAAAGPDEAGAAVGQFFMSLIVGYTFWLSLPIGGLALMCIHYLVKTSWGVLLKRLLEAALQTWPLFLALFLILAASLFVLGPNAPYWWVQPNERLITPDMHEATQKVNDYEANPNGVAKPTANDYFLTLKLKTVQHELEQRQEGTFEFLSPPMFLGIGLVLFAIWGTLIYFFTKWGRESQNDVNKTLVNLEKASNLSGPGLIIYALTLTVAATQWTMSLEPSWASTMFPVIFAMNQFLTCFAFCLAVFLTLAQKPPLKTILRDKFQLDMGTLLLVFTLMWSYTSFSQMMLIWIGNLPEEIPFYLKRSMPTYGFWWWVSAGLIALHFFLPFLLLLFRDIKLHPKRLRAVAIYLLVICAIDVIWWIEPAREHHGFMYLLMDVGAIVGVGGLFGLYFLLNVKKRPLLVTNELFWLPEGHSHHEHH